MKKFKKTAFLIPLIFAVISCVTINIYFPAAAVEKAADRIVDEVWGEKGPEKEKQKKEDKEGFYRETGLYVSLGPSPAYAEEADINISTPAIRAIKESMKKRAASLKTYLDRGNVGITADGMLKVRSSQGLALREKAMLGRLVAAENRDREALYREIARANNFSPDRIPDIKRLFAASWKKKAKKGWWIEGPGGWVQKD